MRGMLHAHLLHDAIQKHSGSSTQAMSVDHGSIRSLELIAQTYHVLANSFPIMLQNLEEKGWKIGDEFVTIEPSNAVRLRIQKERT
jgi:hypothetical protein